MSLKAFLTRELAQYLRIRNVLTHRSYATISEAAKPGEIDITSVDNDPKFEEEVTKIPDWMRNKSRLSEPHRNIMHGRRPYEKPGISYHHKSVQFKKRMLGRFGIEGSGVPPGIAWPTKEEIALAKEFEKASYPQTIQESWAMLAAKKKQEADEIQARQEDIAAKMAKTAQWEKELHAKIAKKEADASAARARKERLMDEVRRHFGFKVDPRDEKFKQMLEQKEKEDKKLRKEAKKKEKADRLMARLLERPSPGKEVSPSSQENNQEKTKASADTP